MNDILDIFRLKLFPWLRQDISKRCIAVTPKMNSKVLPLGVACTRHKMIPPRVLIKNRRCYENVRNIIAKWPRENLQELGKNMIVFSLAGHIDYPLGSYNLQCGSGYFIFIPAGTPTPETDRVYVDTKKSTFCEIITFLQHPNALECWISRCQGKTKIQSDSYLFTDGRLNSLLNLVMQEVLATEIPSPHIINGLLSAFCHMLEQHIYDENFQVTPIDSTAALYQISPPKSVGFSAQLRQYILSNLRQPPSLAKAARDMYSSPAQFTRDVRSATGQSFNQLLNSLRLQKIQELLQDTNWAIFTIAQLTGFHSTSYFCTFFKKHMGQTPSEFRREHQKTT